MKRTVLISLLAAAVGVMTFIGCERPEPIDPTNGQPHRTDDSLINQQVDTTNVPTNDTTVPPTDDTTIIQFPENITVEHWRAERIGYYNYHDGTYHHDETYTYAYMDIYPHDSILYATDIDTLDDYLIISNGAYSPYSMNGDTITVYFPTEMEIAECQRKWMIYRTNDNTMNWQYLGGGIPLSNNNYKFYLIGVE